MRPVRLWLVSLLGIGARVVLSYIGVRVYGFFLCSILRARDWLLILALAQDAFLSIFCVCGCFLLFNIESGVWSVSYIINVRAYDLSISFVFGVGGCGNWFLCLHAQGALQLPLYMHTLQEGSPLASFQGFLNFHPNFDNIS